MQNIFVGDFVGQVKAVDIPYDQDVTVQQPSIFCSPSKAKIDFLQYSGGSVFMATDRTVVKDSQVLLKGLSCKVVGVDVQDGKVVVGMEDGQLAVIEENQPLQQLNLDRPILCIKVNPYCSSQIAVASTNKGLAVYNTKEKRFVFQSKNVKNNWLDLPVKHDINAIEFLSTTQIVVCTEQSMILLYDISIARRPLWSVRVGDFPLRKMLVVNDLLLLADTLGDVVVFDANDKKETGRLKGSAGAVTDLAVFEAGEDTMVVCVGLDRFMRIYKLANRKLIHKICMKQKLSSIAIGESVAQQVEDDEPLWEQMQTVTQAGKRRSSD